jgi:corrinoid protein of di/trimethylamine methyltransferase
MSDEKEILEGLKDSVINFDEDKSAELAQKALDSGLNPQKAIFDGLAAGMEVVGDLFQKGEYFVPEVLMSADALYAGLNILKPHVNVDDKSKVKGEVVIGTVEGDVHDIGKNIVKLMFDIAGFTVHDLGKDVPLDRFVEEQLKTDSDIVALSAMMTTTMTTMKKVIEKIREKNPNVKIMIGGAPVTEETAKAYGADATAKDATNALSEAIKMVASLREMQNQS